MSRISNSSFKVNSSLEQIVAVSGSVDVTATGELPINLKQVDGVSVQLGQTAMSSSIPVNIASDQTDLLTDLNKVGGSPFGQGYTPGPGGAGGGGAGAPTSGGSGVDGTANTGGGGGAGNLVTTCSGAGGSGIVIIRYKFQ